MKKIKTYCRYMFLYLGLVITLMSCKKFLDAKPNANLGTLSTLEDIQLFLDDHTSLNTGKYPAYSEICADTYYLTSAKDRKSVV